MKCPNCGKELDEVIVVQTLNSVERSSYTKVEGSKNVFEYTGVVDNDVCDSQTDGAECPYCGSWLIVERLFNGKVELDDESADTS